MQQDISRFDAIRNKTSAVLTRAKELYGVDIKPSISFNLRGRVAGWAGCKLCRITQHRTYTLRFNSELIQGKHFEDIRDATVAHEVAHLVCYARPELGRKHNDGWRRVCLALGGNGKTRHDYDVTPAGGGVVYRTDRGYEVVVSKIIHSKIQTLGKSYRYRNGKGSISRACSWALQGRPLPLQVQRETTPVVQPVAVQRVATPAAGMSKAEQVRAFIREAKAQGSNDQSWVMHRAMVNLGMGRSQAAKYVSENWNRA